MKFERYLLIEGVLDSALKKIGKKPLGAVKKLFKDNWEKLANIIRDKGLEKDALQIINRHMGSKFRTLEQIGKARIVEGMEVNEDFAHWWDKLKAEAFPTLAFYPALSVWLEMDKLFASSGAGPDWKKVAVYGLMFVLLVSGKYIKEWQKWSRDNPEEAEKEKVERKGLKFGERVKHTFRSI